MAQNASNAQKRIQIELDAWTELYTDLKISTEVTAPVLSRELKMTCDLSASGYPGSFDGPRAWRITRHHLQGRTRTEADKDYYRTAERLQRSSVLPDGCTAAEFSRKALAFLIHIRPNLPQAYDDDDTMAYIINLMPKGLRESGRRIKTELRQEGREHDFMHVIQRCHALVHEEQKTAAPAPAFVVTDADALLHNLANLSDTTGMVLTQSAGHGPAGIDLNTGLAGVGGSPARQWCKDCPHGDKGCFTAPDYEGPLPINVHLNKERVAGIKAAKAANAKESGIPLKPLKEPSRKDIDAFKKRRADRREAAKARDAAKKGPPAAGAAAPPPPAGVGIDDEDVSDWRNSLIELSPTSRVG